MERIASFTVDHLKMQRGIFVSRKDHVGNEVLTSFDIRMKRPYKEPVLGIAEIHTMALQKSTRWSIWRLHGSETVTGKIKLSTGDRWAV